MIYIYIYIYDIYISPPINLMSRVFTICLLDRGSNPSQVIQKTLKMVLDASLLKSQDYNILIKGKVEQFRERSSTLPNNTV